MAEVFVNLVTGGALPDAGEVRIFGRSSSTISDSTEWLAVVDRFGIVSRRAVLLEAFTLLQNVAVPFTLDIESIPAEVESRVVNLAREVGLPDAAWNSAVATLDAASQVRVRLARALALDPDVVLLEHPTVGVDRQQVGPLGEHIRTVARRRGAAGRGIDRRYRVRECRGDPSAHARCLDRTFDRSARVLLEATTSLTGKPWRWHRADADTSAVAEI